MRNLKNINIMHIEGMEPWRGYHSPQKLELLQKSWAGTFRAQIFTTLPVEKLSQFYSDKMGAPTKDLRTAMGVAVLQQIFNLTDEETREHLAFNQQWHYALDTYNPNEQLFAEKTLWTVRYHLTKDGICQSIFNKVTDEFIKTFNVDTDKQRMDSVHVHSNMARLGRARLMARTITGFLRNLKRNHAIAYGTDITEQLRQRYIKEESTGYFGNIKPTESQKRLSEIASDLYWLVEIYSCNEAIKSMNSYKLMQRVLSEQCAIKEGKVEIKPSTEVSPESLQNPSDIDAGYDGHKGQGYQVQLAETYSRKEDVGGEKLKGELTLDLITYVKVESAAKSDSPALQPALDELAEREIKPDEMLVDSLYGGDDNVNQAKAKQVEIISPVMGKKSEKDFIGFEFNEQSAEVKQCPFGKSPKSVIYNKKGTITAKWANEDCANCPLKESCRTEKGAKGRRLRYTKKDIRLWQRRQTEDTPEFKDKYRYRSGIEGTNSRFIHMTGARTVRYRSLENVEFAETMKALGINMFRVARYLIKTGKSIDTIANFGLKVAFCLKYFTFSDKIRLNYEKCSMILFLVKYIPKIA